MFVCQWIVLVVRGGQSKAVTTIYYNPSSCKYQSHWPDTTEQGFCWMGAHQGVKLIECVSVVYYKCQHTNVLMKVLFYIKYITILND